MRKIWCIACIALLCVSCATSEAVKQARAERQLKEAAIVEKGIESKDFKINVNYMYPLGGNPKQLSTLYCVEVKGDSINSYLPYIGRAYSVPYGGGKALNFEGRILRYSAKKVKADHTVVEMQVVNEEAEYFYTLDIFDNGSTTIEVVSHNRDSIRFSGNMEMKE